MEILRLARRDIFVFWWDSHPSRLPRTENSIFWRHCCSAAICRPPVVIMVWTASCPRLRVVFCEGIDIQCRRTEGVLEIAGFLLWLRGFDAFENVRPRFITQTGAVRKFSAACFRRLLFVEIASNFWRNLYLFLLKKSTKTQKSALESKNPAS